MDCDLLDFTSVRAAAATVREHVAGAGSGGLDVLCCNAGIMLQPDAASKDGYDITASTNVLSHFLLTRELMPALERAARRTGDARVVSMSSGSGFGPPAFDPHFYSRSGGSLGGQRASYERYHQSKLANLLFTVCLHQKLTARGSQVKALACTPGVCGTDMFVHVQRLSQPRQPVDLSRVPSVEDGACAQLLCICDPSVESGQLFGPRGLGGPPVQMDLAPPTVLIDDDSKRELWRCCERTALRSRARLVVVRLRFSFLDAKTIHDIKTRDGHRASGARACPAVFPRADPREAPTIQPQYDRTATAHARRASLD